MSTFESLLKLVIDEDLTISKKNGVTKTQFSKLTKSKLNNIGAKAKQDRRVQRARLNQIWAQTKDK